MTEKSVIDKLLLYYGLHMPTHPGKWRAHGFLCRNLGRVYSNYEEDAIRGGIKWRLNPSDYSDATLYWLGLRDSQTLTVLKALTKPESTILDVGSNYGYLSLELCHFLNGNCRIFALEPNPANYRRLLKHVSANGYEASIHCFDVGVSDHSEVVNMRRPATNTGHAIVSPDGLYQNVGLITLDLFCQEQNLRAINILIIDAEGYEERALRGSKQLIKVHKPTLVVELFPPVLSRHGSSALSVADAVSDLGYELFRFEENALCPLTELPSGDYGMYAFCFPKESAAERVEAVNNVLAARLPGVSSAKVASFREQLLLLYGTVLPDHPRKWWVHKMLRAVLKPKASGEHLVKRNGIYWLLDPKDFYHSAFFWTGAQDKWVLHHLEKMIIEDSIVLDGGAGCGFLSLYLANKFTNITCHAVEPSPTTYKRLHRMIALNSLSDRFFAYPLGLSDCEENKRITESQTNSGANLIDDSSSGTMVSITTVDALVAANGIEKLDILILDIEGYEMKGIAGARKTIEIHYPLILLKVWRRTLELFDSSISQLAELLQTLDYEFYRMERDVLRKITELPDEPQSVWVFCMHKDAGGFNNVK